MDTSPIRKNKSGSLIDSGERRVIYNVFKYFRLCESNATVESIVIKTASACGVSENTIYKIIREQKQTNTLKSPVKKRARLSIVDKLDDSDKYAIRRKVHSLYLNNDNPTLDKIMTLCEADQDIPTFKRTTLHKALRELGFDFNKKDSGSSLVEKDDIVLWRRKYLRQMKEYRKANKTIYYLLYKTWVNGGHVKTNTMLNTIIKKESQVGSSPSTKASAEKSKRLIILHVSNNKEITADNLFIFESKSIKDCDDETDGETFLTWFTNILNKLEQGGILVLNKTPKNKQKPVKLENTPTSDWKKQQIIDWLKSEGISMDTTFLKKELLMKVAEINPKYNTYSLVDEIAESRGIKILRLPPYHCKFNPIELAWTQMKNYVATNISTFNMSEVKSKFDEAIRLINCNQWKHCCDYVIEEENAMWHLDDIVELADQNPFTMKMENCSDSD